MVLSEKGGSYIVKGRHKHSARINEIFVSLMKKVLDDQKKSAADLDLIAKEKGLEIEKLATEKFGLEESIQLKTKVIDKMLNEHKEIKKRLDHLEELNETRKSLISEKQTEIERLKKHIEDLTATSKAVLLDVLETQNKELTQKMVLMRVQHENDIQKLQLDHQKEIALIQEKQAKELKTLIITSAVSQSDSEEAKKKRGRPRKNSQDGDDREIEKIHNASSLDSMDGFIQQEFQLEPIGNDLVLTSGKTPSNYHSKGSTADFSAEPSNASIGTTSNIISDDIAKVSSDEDFDD